MANLFEGIANIIQGIFQAIFSVFQGIFNAIYSVFHGVFTLVWDLMESSAQLVGASAHFVLSNIFVIGLLAVALVIYRDRQSRAQVGNRSGKKLQ